MQKAGFCRPSFLKPLPDVIRYYLYRRLESSSGNTLEFNSAESCGRLINIRTRPYAGVAQRQSS
jgi:hypothetical protein